MFLAAIRTNREKKRFTSLGDLVYRLPGPSTSIMESRPTPTKRHRPGSVTFQDNPTAHSHGNLGSIQEDEHESPPPRPPPPVTWVPQNMRVLFNDHLYLTREYHKTRESSSTTTSTWHVSIIIITTKYDSPPQRPPPPDTWVPQNTVVLLSNHLHLTR